MMSQTTNKFSPEVRERGKRQRMSALRRKS